MWKNWALDVTHGHEPMAFCPVDDDGRIVTGMTMVSGKCPGSLIGVFHEGGDREAQRWLKENGEVLAELVAANYVDDSRKSRITPSHSAKP